MNESRARTNNRRASAGLITAGIAVLMLVSIFPPQGLQSHERTDLMTPYPFSPPYYVGYVPSGVSTFEKPVNASIVSAGCTSGCGATYIYPDTWNVQVTLGPSAGGSGYLLFMWENLTSTMETETSIYVTTT